MSSRFLSRPSSPFLLSVRAIALLSLAPTCASAETQLSEILVESAQLGGTEAAAAASGSSFSIITREELERRQVRNAADALRALPGVYIDSQGGSGGVASLRIRGTESNHTKILIDGIEVNSFDQGGFDFATLLAVDIERIEVLRGPQSGIYGGNALAGVVNIITRKGGKPQVSLMAEGGSFNSRLVSGNLSTGNTDGYLSISGARRETDGFNIASVGSEKDGSEQSALFARAGYAFSPIFRVDGMVRRQDNETATDEDAFPDFGGGWRGDNVLEDSTGTSSQRQQTLGGLTGTLTLFDGFWVQKLGGSMFSESYDSKSPTLGDGSNDGDRNRLNYLSQFNFATGELKHTVSGAFERTTETYQSTAVTGDKTRSQTAYIGEYRLNYLNRLYLSGDLRFDDNDTFADATTYKIGASYLFAGWDTRLHSSYGKGIQNPDMVDLYGWDTNFVGNPDLTPETSIGWDVGIEKGFFDHRLVADVTYFESDLTDKISFTWNGAYMPYNADGISHRKGVEVALSAQILDNLKLGASYTYTDSRQPDGSLELRRPYHSAKADIAWNFLDGRGTLDLEAIYRGSIRDFGYFYDYTTVDDYTLVNLAASYKLTDSVELFARGENLLDLDYREIYGYRTPPLAAYAGVKLKLDGGE